MSGVVDKSIDHVRVVVLQETQVVSIEEQENHLQASATLTCASS